MEDYVYICGICDIVMGRRAASVACKSCLHWIHLKCAKLNYNQAKKVQNNYCCARCETKKHGSDKEKKRNENETKTKRKETWH